MQLDIIRQCNGWNNKLGEISADDHTLYTNNVIQSAGTIRE